MSKNWGHGVTATASQGRLTARPSQTSPSASVTTSGVQALRIERPNDALLYIPAGYQADQPAALAVMLHGANGSAQNGLALLRGFADAANLILLAPASRDYTWDVITNQYGWDVSVIDQALAQTFEHYAVDPARVAIGGFSDGASYAISVGLTNGDLFHHIIAFSPGFMAPATQRDKPNIYISHGTRDTVLPIDRCSRRIVPQLERAGYAVRYHEFEGPHTVPPEIVQEAIAWFMPIAGANNASSH